MNIKVELLKDCMIEYIHTHINDFEINADEIATTTAISVLQEIHTALSNPELSDFDAIEEIVCIFEKRGISCGGRHDFN